VPLSEDTERWIKSAVEEIAAQVVRDRPKNWEAARFVVAILYVLTTIAKKNAPDVLTRGRM
jgi:hypothetical protein